MDYKKYSLENLENWLYDAMSAGEATPQEIYDVIVNVVKDNYYTYKKQASEAYELLALLNSGVGNNKYQDYVNKILSCDKNDPSPECKGAWNDFWEENYYPEEVKKDDGMRPWGHSDLEYMIANPTLTENRVSNFPGEQYSEEELNAMCDKAASDQEKEKCREYNLREAEYYNKRAELDALTEEVKAEGGYDWTPKASDKVVRWQLPVQVDGLSGDCFVEFPDDLLEAANLKEGDTVEWVDKGDGSYILRKVTQPLRIDEC